MVLLTFKNQFSFTCSTGNIKGNIKRAKLTANERESRELYDDSLRAWIMKINANANNEWSAAIENLLLYFEDKRNILIQFNDNFDNFTLK